MNDARVILTIPWYRMVDGEGLPSLDRPCDLTRESPNRCIKVRSGGAFIARNFNTLFCEMLNQRVELGATHKGMIHVDVETVTPFWMDVMLEELEKSGADLLHIVLPIKTVHGLTSTAIEHKQTGAIRRLTMQEVGRIPEITFDAASAGFPDWRLLPSTGLWVMDLRRPWFTETWPNGPPATPKQKEQTPFEVRDRIFRHADGRWDYETIPEDWHFGRLLHSLGAKIVGSTCVACNHWGPFAFQNQSAWGTMTHDEEQPALDWATEKS